MSTEAPNFDAEWDAGDLGCGELVLQLRFRMQKINAGQLMRIHASDAGAPHDIPAWCRMSGHELVDQDTAQGFYWIRRSAR